MDDLDDPDHDHDLDDPDHDHDLDDHDHDHDDEQDSRALLRRAQRCHLHRRQEHHVVHVARQVLTDECNVDLEIFKIWIPPFKRGSLLDWFAPFLMLT